MSAILPYDPVHGAVEWLAGRGHGARARVLLHATGSASAALRLAAMLRGDYRPPDAPVPPSSLDDPPPESSSATATPAPVVVPAPEPATLQAAEGCIHRDPGVGCCPVTTCELARRRVTILDCLACIRDRDLDVQSGHLTVAIPQVIVVQ